MDEKLISRVMAEMGRRGGSKGGRTSSANMTKKQRIARAKKAAAASAVARAKKAKA
jgi:hypothetical protein